jgi:hypothetical protein
MPPSATASIGAEVEVEVVAVSTVAFTFTLALAESTGSREAKVVVEEDEGIEGLAVSADTGVSSVGTPCLADNEAGSAAAEARERRSDGSGCGSGGDGISISVGSGSPFEASNTLWATAIMVLNAPAVTVIVTVSGPAAVGRATVAVDPLLVSRLRLVPVFTTWNAFDGGRSCCFLVVSTWSGDGGNDD